MNWTDYSERFKAELNKSSERQKMGFAIEICERLLPDYYNFVNQTNWGNANTISKALEFVKSPANGKLTQAESINNLVREVEKNTPDLDDFGQISGSLALNSCTAILETLNFLLDKKSERIMDIASFSYDSVYFKVGDLNPEFTEIEIQNHVDLQKEIKWQMEKLKFLA